mmetsp:Transcript_116386/g.370246  ORF Transcript_116386/g.370246 Transcript_116386/m.370246 type:complete len:229 (-) Transcript_116386:54-740(-)
MAALQLLLLTAGIVVLLSTTCALCAEEAPMGGCDDLCDEQEPTGDCDDLCDEEAPMGDCDDFSKWPNVDNGVTCGSCKALVVAEEFGNVCATYCESFGHKCAAAQEETDEDCEVAEEGSCDKPIAPGSSDILCTCTRTGEMPQQAMPECCDGDGSCDDGDDDYCCGEKFYCSNDGADYAAGMGGILCPAKEKMSCAPVAVAVGFKCKKISAEAAKRFVGVVLCPASKL